MFTQTVARPDSGDQARRAEDRGWDGMSFVDSQNLSGDVYVAMTTAAAIRSPPRQGASSSTRSKRPGTWRPTRLPSLQ